MTHALNIIVRNTMMNKSRSMCPASNTKRQTGSNHMALEELMNVSGTLSRETIPNGFVALQELGVKRMYMSRVQSKIDMSTILEYIRP